MDFGPNIALGYRMILNEDYEISIRLFYLVFYSRGSQIHVSLSEGMSLGISHQMYFIKS